MHKIVSSKLYVTRPIKDALNKKQILILLPFLGAQSFFSWQTTAKLYKKLFTILLINNRFSIENKTFHSISF